MQQVISELERLGRRSKSMLVIQRAAALLTWILAGLIAAMLFDYAIRLPSGFRLAMLLLGLGGIGYAVWTYLRPAVLFHPKITELALRVERVLPALSGRLASSVEFAIAGIDEANQLAARSVRETQTRLAGESVKKVINASFTWRNVGMLAVMASVWIVIGIVNPAFAATGLGRLLLPYSDAKWPARTGVESLTTATVHPRGQSLALRAGVTRGAVSQRIDAHYRLRVDGEYQPWQRIVLTHQFGGNIHERLVEANADEIEFYFTSDDDQTDVQSIQLVPPPSVRRASLTVTPPAYAAGHVPVYQTELGQGIDARAVTDRPSLNGSTATLRLELNKPLPTPASVAETFGWETSASAQDASETEGPDFAVSTENRSIWTLQWRVNGTRTLSLHLVDEYGLSNADAIAYRIEAVEDHAPAVTVTQPQSDETVLAGAVVGLRTEARDDVALSKLALQAHVQSGGKSAEEAIAQAPAWERSEDVAEPTAKTQADLDLGSLHLSSGDTVLVSGVARDGYGEGGDAALQNQHEVRSPLRKLRVIGETDFATQLRRQLSAVRQNAIRIESQQAELQDDVAENGVPAGSGIDRAQAQISERIAAQRASVEDIERLVRQNRLDDQQLSQILQQANDLLDAAGRAANKAVESIERRRAAEGVSNPIAAGVGAEKEKSTTASQPNSNAASDPSKPQANEQNPSSSGKANQEKPVGDAADQQDSSGQQSKNQTQSGGQRAKADAHDAKSEEDRKITDAQQEVRDELTDLIKLLDRDEDTWVVKQQLDSLAKQQAELEQATTRTGEQTIGKRPDELVEQQRTELDRIAQKQRDLRDEARKLIENLRNRAKAMEQVDPQAAQAMRSAADTAEQRQLDQDMENAAQKAQQNQMTSATAAQQSAQSTMQKMRDDIENTRRAQAQQLIRQLASLVESIQRLITVQEGELTALGLAKDAQNFSGLDRSMIRLNQNTQAVAGEARAAGQEARRIARSLDRAADTQGAAVAALRAQPINAAEAEASENRSLELLKEAKAAAEELQKKTQDQEIQKRREELIGAYRKFAERQVAVREETLPLAGQAQLDRRQLVEARRLGTSQDEIRTGLNTLRDTTSEVLDSPIFVHVHKLIDVWSSAISDALSNGTVNVDVTDRQQQIADSIGRLIKALEESVAPPDEFAKDQQQNSQNGQGGQGQQALIPPIAQLKLLREVQEQVYNLTKQLDTRGDLDAAQKRTRLREIGQQQRELMDLGKQMLEALQRNRPPALPNPEGEKPEPSPDKPGEPQPQ